MKTKMRVTSLVAFEEIIPTLQNREIIVLQALKQLRIANNLMIARHLHLPVNCITGRIFSLRSLGLVHFYKKDKCPYTDKTTIYWKIPEWINGVLA